MVLHGGRPCPEQVVDALTEVASERDAARAEVERLLGVLQSLVAAYDEPNNGRYIRWEIDEARAALSTKGGA
jgi:uncharacterized coiled-coil DUF342 family protein